MRTNNILRIKKTIILLSGMLFLLFLSGCDANKTGGQSDDWEKDILYAKACGFDGMSCCIDQEPSCLYGQTCCPHPANASINHCFEDCTCGIADRFCCPGENPCGDGLYCFEGFCVGCGEVNELCCSDEKCEGDLACKNGKCVPCGELGNPCCLGEIPCRTETDEKNRIECRNNSCSYCGSRGGVACLDEPFCLAQNLLNNGICFSCGNINEPCCNKDDGIECADELECELGFCS